MEYFAATKKLAKTLNNPSLLIKSFGKDRAKRIIQRLDEFDSAFNLEQISSAPPSRCHKLHNNLEGKFAVDISKNYRIIFEGYDKSDKLSTDRKEIVTIQIIEISDYH